MPITMQINASRIAQKFPTKNQPFIHKLQVFVVSPNVTVLLFFKVAGIARGSFSAELNLFLVIGLAVKGGSI